MARDCCTDPTVGTPGAWPEGFWGDSQVFTMVANPKGPKTLYAGTEEGVFKSRHNGNSCEHPSTPMDSLQDIRGEER